MNSGNSAQGAFGAYVHFPYCLKKCPYCDFVSFKADRPAIPHEAYADAVVAELEARAPALDGRALSTIFFGGGTPSLWSSRDLGRVIRAIVNRFAALPDLEITVECNPTSLDVDKARSLRDEGVNRLSVGVQAIDDERLAFLGRLHDSKGGLAALEAAVTSGMPRVSGDLIFGVAPAGRPESPETAAAEALAIARTGVTHVSAYALTIEPNTEFGALAKRGKLPLATDDLVVDSFFAVEDALASVGLAHYETSNYARPGDESRHNLGYWLGRDYLGLGAGACGTITSSGRTVRTRNVADPRKYMSESRDADAITLEREELRAVDRFNERVMLGLRLADGVDLASAAHELGLDAEALGQRSVVDRLTQAGKLREAGGRLFVPRDKRALTDGIAAALFV